MKKFFTFMFASCLGFILALGLLTLIGIGLINRQAKKAVPQVKTNSVLQLDFSKAIPEKTNNVAVNNSPLNFQFETGDVVGLYDMTRAIRKAKTDSKIKGIFLDLTGSSIGSATASVVRDALIDFKESGKFIYSYSDNYTQGTYYLASSADSIFANPRGAGVDFRGMAASIPFFKDMLDRLGVKMQVVYVGNFKSATEPFRMNQMSPDNKLQVREYLDGLYNIYLEDISSARKIPVEQLKNIANEYKIRNAEDAIEVGFVDKLCYRGEMVDFLKEKLGLDDDKKVKTTSIGLYASTLKPSIGKDKVAVVFAEGSIVDGNGEAGSIGGKKYAKLIRKIRKDKKVKAIVLRVNSGGGSAFASEEIWHEIELAKKQGLPVITSMGDVAASGGYYIACNSDTIFAEPNTITGSIGIFGMIPSVQTMLKNKVGVEFDTVKTGQFATGISPFFNMSPKEEAIVQEMVDEGYELFLKRVGEGRGMNREETNKVAQGRVWTGEAALKNGLVDVLGGLEDAIALAAKKADLDKYKVAQYPVAKNPFSAFLENLTGKSASAQIKNEMIEDEIGSEGYQLYQMMKEAKNATGIQARMPFEIIIH